jgi:predicted nucleic acid-binding protein
MPGSCAEAPCEARSVTIRMLDLVIDTNVVLDWLAFRRPIGAPLQEALISRQCRWLCTAAMRDELARVVVRDSLARWAIDARAVLAVFDALAVDTGPAPPLGVAERLHCSDPDDQMFVDLAIARRAHALLTRDRAVLRLSSRARRFDVLIATPESWLRLRQQAPDRSQASPGVGAGSQVSQAPDPASDRGCLDPIGFRQYDAEGASKRRVTLRMR